MNCKFETGYEVTTFAWNVGGLRVLANAATGEETPAFW